MEHNARIAAHEQGLCVQLNDELGLRLMRMASGRVDLDVGVLEGKLVVHITPNREGRFTVGATDPSKELMPFRVRTSSVNLPVEVMLSLGRSRYEEFDLVVTGQGALIGEVELEPHLRPWPRLINCKRYDLGERAVEVMRERMASTAAAGDVWQTPPKEFLMKCPKSFMDILRTMPEGFSMKMEGGRIAAR